LIIGESRGFSIVSWVSEIHAASILSRSEPAVEDEDTSKLTEVAPAGEGVSDAPTALEASQNKTSRPLGRPRLDRDFTAICDALVEGRDEPGVVARVAREFDVSLAWLYKWIIPTLDDLLGNPAGNEEESESANASG
jgi:hypothetical protein